jgi:hypothetical protein
LADRLSIYVSSFDDYADIWPVFFSRFFKHWPNCPFPVYLGTVSKTHDDGRVLPLHAADHKNWSSRAIEHLQQVKSPFVLMLLEDFMLDRPVDSDLLSRLVALMDRFDLHAIRLFPDPPPALAMPGVPLIGFQGQGQPNRTSTHATIWRRESLLELIRPGESLWEFEINGSIRSNRFAGGICGCWRPALHYVMAIGKGRWFRRALRDLARDGIRPDLSVRSAETFAEELTAAFLAFAGNILRALMPLYWRQRLQVKFNPRAYRD